MKNEVYDNPLNKGFGLGQIKILNIAFDEMTSHYAIYKQIVDGLKKLGYANIDEIKDIFRENIK